MNANHAYEIFQHLKSLCRVLKVIFLMFQLVAGILCFCDFHHFGIDMTMGNLMASYAAPTTSQSGDCFSLEENSLHFKANSVINYE